jgi:hypothetical protein
MNYQNTNVNDIIKKIFSIVLLILVTSCSSDNEENKSPIQNPSFPVDLLLKRWTFDKVIYNSEIYNYIHQPNCMKDEFTFANQEGQIRQYNELIFVNDICSTNGLNLEWKIKNDIISFYFGTQFVINYTIISVTETKLIYSYYVDVDQNGEDDLITIEAIPYE